MQKYILCFALILFVCACGSTAYQSGMVNGKPYWYWYPSDGDLAGGVGEAGFHIAGESAQRNLAVSRAIDSIAMQKGVTVQSIQQIEQQAVSSGASSAQITAYSVYTVEGMTLSTKVREFWLDPSTNKLVVWVTEVKYAQGE